MPETTVQIEDLLSKMARRCCESVQGESDLTDEEIQEMVASLSTNGWQRHKDDQAPLAVEIENRVKEQGCPAVETHPREITAMTERIAQSYQRYADEQDVSAPPSLSGDTPDATQK